MTQQKKILGINSKFTDFNIAIIKNQKFLKGNPETKHKGTKESIYSQLLLNQGGLSKTNLKRTL